MIYSSNKTLFACFIIGGFLTTILYGPTWPWKKKNTEPTKALPSYHALSLSKDQLIKLIEKEHTNILAIDKKIIDEIENTKNREYIDKLMREKDKLFKRLVSLLKDLQSVAPEAKEIGEYEKTYNIKLK